MFTSGRPISHQCLVVPRHEWCLQDFPTRLWIDANPSRGSYNHGGTSLSHAWSVLLLMRQDVPVIRSNVASMRGLVASSMNRIGPQETNIMITVSQSICMKEDWARIWWVSYGADFLREPSKIYFCICIIYNFSYTVSPQVQAYKYWREPWCRVWLHLTYNIDMFIISTLV